ncbi:MAG TPA: GNAT family protein [Allosphingosinicella sp.]|nr:GNAT family protein [Allosphingosinicella sp.]
MISIEPFAPHHLAGLTLQTAQRPELAGRAAGAGAELGPAFTALRDGVVLGCAGLAESHAGHATAWALFAEGHGVATWAALTAAIRRVLDAADYRRVDMLVRDRFERAHEFARRLGFEQEGVLRRYGADGSDYAVYARIREEGGDVR